MVHSLSHWLDSSGWERSGHRTDLRHLADTDTGPWCAGTHNPRALCTDCVQFPKSCMCTSCSCAGMHLQNIHSCRCHSRGPLCCKGISCTPHSDCHRRPCRTCLCCCCSDMAGSALLAERDCRNIPGRIPHTGHLCNPGYSCR